MISVVYAAQGLEASADCIESEGRELHKTEAICSFTIGNKTRDRTWLELRLPFKGYTIEDPKITHKDSPFRAEEPCFRTVLRRMRNASCISGQRTSGAVGKFTLKRLVRMYSMGAKETIGLDFHVACWRSCFNLGSVGVSHFREVVRVMVTLAPLTCVSELYG